MEQRLQHLRQVGSDFLEQMMLESVALRRELGLPGGRLTEEQQKTYLEAKQNLWRSKMTAKKTNSLVTKPQS
jgi:hypothetical protein